ncbi:MAG: uroporphyrinogen-III synthase [Enterobacteriaceae bacterium]
MAEPHVLITRPSPEGQQLLARLLALNIKASHTPLIDFVPGQDLPRLIPLLQALQDGDLLIALSPRAVRYAAQHLQEQQIPWPSNIHYLAIGHGSAQLLAEACQQEVLSPEGAEISEHLLQLPTLQQLSGRQVMLLRGNDGRQLLATTLQARGARVIRCECYRRYPLSYDGTQLAIDWQQQGINTLLITSGEMLDQIVSLVPDHARSWLLSCHLVVVSERLASLALQYGWRHIKIAQHADNDALLRAIQKT